MREVRSESVEDLIEDVQWWVLDLSLQVESYANCAELMYQAGFLARITAFLRDTWLLWMAMPSIWEAEVVDAEVDDDF